MGERKGEKSNHWKGGRTIHSNGYVRVYCPSHPRSQNTYVYEHILVNNRPLFLMDINTIIHGDALEILKTLPDESIDCCVTSPPYWSLRNYEVDEQIGLEPDFKDYLIKLLDIFCEVKRVLKKNGTCWVNLGDTYFGGGRNAGNKSGNKYKQDTVRGSYNPFDWSGTDYHTKCLLMIPERFAIGMIEQGWLLRNKVIWHKKNAMPSSVIDRLSNKYELVYFFSKNKDYFFDLDSIRVPYETNEKRPDGMVRAREYGYNTKQGTKRRAEEEEAKRFGKRRPPQNEGDYERNKKGKNPGDVWTLTLQPHAIKHIAMFPEKLIRPMIQAGCPPKGVVLDPFMGSGTTACTARGLGRNYIGIELNAEYIKLAEKRLAQQVLL